MTVDGPESRRRANHGWAPLVAILAVLVALTGIALAIVHAKDSSHTSGAACKKPSVTAEVDLRPADGTVDPGKLNKTADILRQRLSVYGCSDVRVDGEHLRVSTSATGLDHLDELIAPGDLQFREVLEAAPGGQCLSVSPIVDPDEPLTACSQDGAEQFSLAPARIVGSDIKGAVAQQDQQLGQWQVIVNFTAGGQQTFTAVTRQLVGKRLAIMLDGSVISAPNIQEQVDGDAQITGSFTESSAKALANLLEHGALPVQLVRA